MDMGFSARVLLDSLSPAGVRLVSMEARYPRFIHAQFLTHRVFSRNAASSRAIPIKKMISSVREDPATPVHWGKNQAGMSARQETDEAARSEAQMEWRRALENALASAERLCESDINLHKQLVNRILEPFAWITVIVSGTEWSNFFTQRCHEDAQPEIKHLAETMLAAFNESAPQPVAVGEWHLPLVAEDERTLDVALLRKLSVARCARVSYLTHEGVRDREKDVELFERLLEGGANGHWSPFEHVATPLESGDEWGANLRGWKPFRKFFYGENALSFPERRLRVPASH